MYFMIFLESTVEHHCTVVFATVLYTRKECTIGLKCIIVLCMRYSMDQDGINDFVCRCKCKYP